MTKGPSTASGEGGNTTSESGRTDECSHCKEGGHAVCDLARARPTCGCTNNRHHYGPVTPESTDRPGQPGKNSTDRAGLDGRSLSQSVESPVTPEYTDASRPGTPYSDPVRTGEPNNTPCRCTEVEGYGIDSTACRADVHARRPAPENTDQMNIQGSEQVTDL